MTLNRLHSHHEAGVTLTEIMVTLVIIGMMSSAVVLSIASRPSALETEADRLYARLLEAEKIALTTGEFVGFSINSNGTAYSFLRYRDEAWTQWDNNPALDSYELPDSLSLLIAQGARPQQGSSAPVIWMDPAGYLEPFEFRLRGSSDEIVLGRDETGDLFIGDDLKVRS